MTTGKWHPKRPESFEKIAHMQQSLSFPLPASYLNFLRIKGAGSGDLGIRPWSIQLWTTDEVPVRNSRLEVAKNAPGFVAFASDGAGELFMFQQNKPGVYIMPFVGMESSVAILIASNFDELTNYFGIANCDDD